jgi:hypothetical protein
MAAVEENPNSKKEEVYIIGGIGYIHEYDNKHRFRIPNGATVVVVSFDEKEYFNFLGFYQDYFNHLLPILIDIGKESSYNHKTLKETLYSSLDDIKSIYNKDKFIKDTNLDLDIYSAGEECPYMHHSLLLYHNGQIIQDRNGIMKYDKIKDSVTTLHTLTSDECLDPEFITNLYKNSELPKKDQVEKIVKELQETHSSTLLSSLLLSKDIHKTQKELCQHPGIYYTFVMKRKGPKVYWIGGHGSEEEKKTFIVPKGCTIVVKEVSGDSAFLNPRYLEKMLTMPIDKLQYPTRYKLDIKQLVPSVAIYTENMPCPVFNYTLLSCFDDMCNKDCSGILDMNLLQKNNYKSTPIHMPNMLKEYNLEFLNTLKPLYNYSVYPTPKEIGLYFQQFVWGENNGTHKIGNNVDVYESLESSPIIKIQQEDVCYRFPGVYYHFICRTQKNNIPKIGREIYTNTIAPTPINSLYPSSNNITSTFLKKRIAEAWRHRSNFQRNTYIAELEKKLSNIVNRYRDITNSGMNATDIKEEYKSIRRLLNIINKEGGSNTRYHKKTRNGKNTTRRHSRQH